ncbi:unnamed protein product, partial [Mesorhabditis belari]|uniref:Uncharacterized protein n=1 Tax=Mesorhabditis belari TaxID=2138241 RepID=A0AAF3EYY0_9BILA
MPHRQLIPIERSEPVSVTPSLPPPTLLPSTTLPPITVTFPSFVYRPKAKEIGRDPYFDNILQEVEEYDDFLDQEAQYRESYPYARLPLNPYLQLHPGQLLPPLFQRGVTIDNSGYIKPLENHEVIGTFDGKARSELPAQQVQQVQQAQQPQQPAQQYQQQTNQNPLYPQQQYGVSNRSQILR